ncbi:hypothetical protein HMPREF2787_09345 [Corynebacterium sp. HMSC061H03]|nr:hypothetical protein HMPREF2787_09345 [Corynebacterium sp. HMSC061H03]
MEGDFTMGLMDKAKEALSNEENTDKVLDKAEQLGKEKLGEDKADQIKKVRDMADERLGDKK